MAVPTTREEFKNYCLRSIGAPVNDINVDPEQLEDRIDEALAFWRDYHFDGQMRVLLPYQITASDITNKYITLSGSNKFQGIIRVFDVGDASTGSSALFNIRYQIHLNQLFDFTNTSIAPYVDIMRYIETMEEVFVGSQPIRFNRHTNTLHIDMTWDKVTAGNYLIVDGYQYTDPDTYPAVWDDPWLKKYASALFQRQWGMNLLKFNGVTLPSGLVVNGSEIYQDANNKIQELEQNVPSMMLEDMSG